jgi:putative phage-type endonuclease
MTRQEFLERRKGGIGGSDAAVIAGLSKYGTELELYLEKRGELDDDFKVSGPLFWGTRNETNVADVFAETMGLKVRRTSHQYVHPEHPFMRANLDRIIEGTDTLLECKTSNAYLVGEWGKGIELEITGEDADGNPKYEVVDPDWQLKLDEVSYDEVPEYYLCQVQHSLAASGRKDAYLAVLIGGNNFRIFYIQRDEAFINALIELESRFWTRVLDGDAPTADYSHSTTADLLKRRYAGTTLDAVVLNDRALDLFERQTKLKEEKKAIEGELDTISNEILDMVGEHAAAILPGDNGAWTRKLQKGGPVSYMRKDAFVVRYTKKTPTDLPIAAPISIG